MPNQALSIDLREDGREVRLRLELDVLPTFFEWFELWFDWLREIASRWYQALLSAKLASDLGACYGRDNAFTKKECPDCGSRSAVRKGWRSRSLAVPRIGTASVKRPYVECRRCGRSWSPYEEEMGLMPRRRYQRASLVRPLQALMRMSYAAAAGAYPESPSAMTLWRFVQAQQPPIGTARPGDGTCLVDATYIPGDGPRGQLPVGLAHMIRRSAPRHGRAALRHRVVAVVAGREELLRPALARQDIDTLVHDGRIEMGRVAKRVGRCRWHVPHRIHRTLHEDGITGVLNRRLTQQVAQLVYEDELTSGKRIRLTRWATQYRRELPATTSHLLRASDELLLPYRYPDAFEVVATSPIEREMREVNRRMENGSHWSVAGAEAFLKHHQIARYEPERYLAWVKSPKTNGAHKPNVSQT